MASPFLAFAIRPFMQQRNARRLIITSADGIQERRYVTIGGIQQWVTIRGQERNNPVLLLIHGGPGSPYAPLSSWLLDWERHFTIVQWDQRGAGKTFQKNGVAGSGNLTLDRLADDGIELTEYLCTHLGKKKIIVIGSSTGTLVGLIMAHKRPNLFHAYVGTEQSSPDSRGLTYRLTTEASQKINDKKGLALLRAMGSDDVNWTRQQFEAMIKLAIRASKNVPDMVKDIMLPALLFSPDYTMRDIKDMQKGMEFSMDQLFNELMSFDIRSLGYDFRLPFFIFQGEGDIITPVAKAKEYFDHITAPHKEFVLIAHAGHLAEFCNPDQFLHELRARVRPFAEALDGPPRVGEAII